MFFKSLGLIPSLMIIFGSAGVIGSALTLAFMVFRTKAE